MNFIVAEDTTKRHDVLGVIYIVCVAKKTEIILKKIGAESSVHTIAGRRSITKAGRGKF
jgi:hypothetical protein